MELFKNGEFRHLSFLLSLNTAHRRANSPNDFAAFVATKPVQMRQKETM